MLFNLSLKNIKKSFKDYAIYFLTLVLGVSIFYMFNSLDSQEAMLIMSNSTREVIKLLVELMGYVSVFVAVVLGLLIIYANKFLINRRKKEFGIYMTLGMGKRKISSIIILETLFVGILSLAVGLGIGIFASQFMSVLVAKIFDADMSQFRFVFSQNACIKTCIYFAIVYIFVMIFNTFIISKYKLINLINASKKSEKVKNKNPIISVIVFILASLVLGWAYWKVTDGFYTWTGVESAFLPILAGGVGTLLAFWAFGGFSLRIVQTNKKAYLKNTNMFVLRQLGDKINTNVISVSIICIMLFFTISILSFSLSLQSTMMKDFERLTPVDLNFHKFANLTKEDKMQYGNSSYHENRIADSYIPIQDTLKNNGFDMSLLKDIIEVPIYTSKDVTLKTILGSYYETAKSQYRMLDYDAPENIFKLSDYNKIAKLYGNEEFTLEDDEYIEVCNYDGMLSLRHSAFNSGNNKIALNGRTYTSKYDTCKDGFYLISPTRTNTGFIIVPDSTILNDEQINERFLAANYNVSTKDEKVKIEEMILDSNSSLKKSLNENHLHIDGELKYNILQASAGLSAVVIFIAIYIGIIFLIASSAILALKQLTESSDNKQRYAILRKIGCDEKMINKSLFMQIGIFFILPLILALIHSIFGIQFLIQIMGNLTDKNELIPSIILSTIIIGGIYGGYFYATYNGSKNIIKEEL